MSVLLPFYGQKRRGFTYIEVLLATAIFASIFTILGGLLLNAISLKDEGSQLKLGIQLGQAKMDEIRKIKKESNDFGDFPSYLNFSFHYEVLEEEKNLLEESGLLGSEFDEGQGEHADQVQEHLEKNNEKTEFSTLTTIKFLVYKVDVLYRGVRIYNLESYRVRGR